MEKHAIIEFVTVRVIKVGQTVVYDGKFHLVVSSTTYQESYGYIGTIYELLELTDKGADAGHPVKKTNFIGIND